MQDANEAIEYLIKALIKEDSYLTSERAKALVLNTFDIIIQTKKDDIGRRKVSSISQINLLAKNGFVTATYDIFSDSCGKDDYSSCQIDNRKWYWFKYGK
mgnify:CR=1 FL=1